ncbi:hypothetical protein CLAIMM_14215 [Cladophialophora immunda]|nr:hypothetical protein CLAIMM_14215 [Cladophialophora immunda]
MAVVISPPLSYINPPDLHPPLSYSHVSTIGVATKSGTVAGQVGQDSSGQTSPAYDTQVAQAFANLRSCLAAAGTSPTNVTKLTYYVVDYDLSKLSAVGDGLQATFALDRFPPCTLVPVPALASPEFLFEIDATAVAPDESTAGTVSDVVVIGAGLSGLEAARKIQAAGLSCLVLEAMDRVGGKTLSVPSVPGRATIDDVRAAWINDTSQSEMYKLFQRYRLERDFQRTSGNTLHQDRDRTVAAAPYGNSPLSEEGAGAVAKLLPAWSRLIEEHNLEHPAMSPQAERLDGMSFARYREDELKLPAVVEVANQITRALLSVEADEISALFLTDYIKSATGFTNIVSDKKDGGQYIRCKTGMQSICHYMAKELKPGSLQLHTPVATIQQTERGCVVRSSIGAVFRSKKNSILGYYSKMVLVWDKPWWRDQGFSGILQSRAGPASFTRDTSIEAAQQWSISCFIVGNPRRRWSQLSQMMRKKSIWDQFRAAFEHAGARVPEPINFIGLSSSTAGAGRVPSMD